MEVRRIEAANAPAPEADVLEVVDRQDLSPGGDRDEVVTQGMYMALVNLIGSLKTRRLEMGLTIAEVAKRSGLTVETLSRLENMHNRNPSFDTVYRYAMALDRLVTMDLEEIDSNDEHPAEEEEGRDEIVLRRLAMPAQEMTSRFDESKVEGMIHFLAAEPATPISTPAKAVGQPHDAVIHLVEFELDERRSFWFGTAEVACSLEQLILDASHAGLPSRPEGSGFDPGEFNYRIELTDGRSGFAKPKGSECKMTDWQHIQIDFVGLSKLLRS